MLLTLLTTLAVPAFFLGAYVGVLSYRSLRRTNDGVEIVLTGFATLAAGTVSLVALAFLVARFVSDV